jgi:protocatechuate 3,4-dioxygenase beta subunit
MPGFDIPSRRVLLKTTLAVGGLYLAAPLARAQNVAPTPACHDPDEPTKPDIEGPFFKPSSPERADLVATGTRGRIFQLEGMVLTRNCKPVPNVLLDLWHADENGDYDNSGFRYRGHLHSDNAGNYRFRTIMPGLYPGRTRHYHFKVQAPRRPILTTQLYFPNEPRNELDDFFQRELLMRIANGSGTSVARFDFILNIA